MLFDGLLKQSEQARNDFQTKVDVQDGSRGCEATGNLRNRGR